MLVLTRKKEEAIQINDNITITILDIMESKVKIGIDAPRDISVLRRELFLAGRINAEASQPVSDEMLQHLDRLKVKE